MDSEGGTVPSEIVPEGESNTHKRFLAKIFKKFVSGELFQFQLDLLGRKRARKHLAADYLDYLGPERSLEEGKYLTSSEATTISYLKDLGINWEYLKGKKILDIGAAKGEFAKEAIKRGIEVTSLDSIKGGMGENERVEDVPYVTASALNLPFDKETFDLILSRATLHSFANREDLIQALQEANRVLKKGGELRFGPGFVNANIFNSDEGIYIFDKNLSRKEIHARKQEKFIDLLKTIFPNVALTPGNQSPDRIADGMDKSFSVKKAL